MPAQVYDNKVTVCIHLMLQLFMNFFHIPVCKIIYMINPLCLDND